MGIKIQLVRCPLDDSSLSADQWNMPLDLLVVGDAIDKRCETEILDGTLLGLEGVRKRLDPRADCIGFTYSALSSGSLKALTVEGKSNGAIVIVGGQPAIGAYRSLVVEKSIDAVCMGDGEPTMASLSQQLLDGRVNLAKIPNLLLLNDDELLETPMEKVDVWNQKFTPRDIGGLNPIEYLSHYPETNTLINMRGKRAANLFSKRGCQRHCSFCARQDKKLRLRNPSNVADDIAYLVKIYNIDYILDTCDTWIVPQWGKAFIQAREQKQVEQIEMMVFADARDVTVDVCHMMRSCGITSVLLGIESGSESILKRNGKIITRREIIDAVDHLLDADIKVSCSFVLGLLYEDEDSLYETIKLTEVLHQRPGVLCYGNVIIPLMGSLLWETAFPPNKPWPSFITRAMDYDLNLIRELYVSTAINIPGGVKRLKDACKEILTTSELPIKEYAR